ncbi:MAG: sulfite exporter TauE/SafE family protein [Candidatus Bathyarchaeia archaeon]
MHPLEPLVLLALGVGVGAYGTLMGAGGGFVMVPLLITIYELEPRVAAGTSLVFVFFNALSGSIAYLKQRHVDIKTGIMFTLMTAPGAVLGAFATSYLTSNTFKLAFAAILITASVYLVIRPLREDKASNLKGHPRRIVDNRGVEYKYSVRLIWGFITSFLAGFVSSIFGIGGGIIHVPAMILLIGFPPHIATATSHLILAFSSLVGSATHAYLGDVNFELAVPLGLGATLGAQLGASIAQRIREVIIERLLALALVAVAIRLLL